ncbi:hypothetical protein BROC_01653 [Candidatus Brocadiaceae bacterium]|nr:hypothetical protein BROC_01653 [Candidatus Brocadiaceae bacterium]
MTKWNSNVAQHRVISISLSLILSGCTLPFMTIDGKSTEEFAHYVEDVFRLQNSMTSQIMAIGDSDEKPKNFDVILQSEQTMQKQCEPLNEYATRDIEGLSVDLALQKRVADSAKNCETAAKAVKKLLPK